MVTKDLAAKYGTHRVSDAIRELVWVHKETRCAKLRPETMRVLRPMIGPFPDDPDLELWWHGKDDSPQLCEDLYRDLIARRSVVESWVEWAAVGRS